MYKKLMFLISLVILLGLVSSAPAAEVKWDNGGSGDSWCTPENWDGDALPGSGDTAVIDCDSASDGPTIDCDVTIATLRGPAWDGKCNHEMAIVSGTFNLTELERDEEFEDGTITYNMSGGTINCAEDWRMPDHGTMILNISGGVFNCGGELRGADEDDGVMYFNVSGGVVNNTGDEINIGDNGTGTMDFSGGVVNCNLLKLTAREGTSTIIVRDTAVVNAEDIELNEDDEGNANLLMQGGTCNVTGDLKLGLADGNAMVLVSGGTLTVEGTTYVPDDSEGTLIVAGGLMKTCHLVVGDDGMVELTGGTLEITCSGSITCDGGAINITTGTLVLPGDQCGSLPSCVTAYYVDIGGGCAGSRGSLNCVFDGEKTIVTAGAPNLYKAWSPTPSDGAVWQSVDVILCWCEGDCLWRSSVYLGMDPVAVENAALGSPLWKGYYNPGECVDPDMALSNPVTLGLWETWYWRVDEITRPDCPPGTPQNTKGDVWSFTTGCELIPGDINLDCHVNFLDYAMLADDWRECVFFPDDVTP
jgi:hypothetical protein